MATLKRALSSATLPTFAGVFGVSVSLGLIALASCSSDDKGSEFTDGGSSGASSTSSGGSSGSSGFNPGPPPEAGPPPVCVSQEAQAIEGKRPVDIIFAIDNSISMADEIAKVEAQINDNFATIIQSSGLDYHVVMLSKHGAHDVPGAGVDASAGAYLQKICVKAPLSGTTCSPIPTQAAETANFIQHDIVINSQDSWCQILKTFNGPDDNGSHPQGWSQFLRANAFKTFVVITDDRVNTSCNPFGSPTPLVFDDKTDDPVSGTTAAGTFDSALLATSSTFGTAVARNYKWHSIVGVAAFNASDVTQAYPPSAAINTSTCSAEDAPATGYQALSKLTGGLRYHLCASNYTAIFGGIAQDVIKTSHVSCDYAVPANPQGGTIDPATAVVRYTTGSSQVIDFGQVANQAACADDKFYIEGDRIKLCPNSCLKVTNDPGAAVKILFGCLPKDTGQK